MIKIHGKDYVTVAERLQLIHQSGKAFQVIDSLPVQVGERWIWRAIILVEDRTFVGNAEVKLTARAGSPDATDPWACGETSAIGRALAFAGYSGSETIASADEVMDAPLADAAIAQNVTRGLSEAPASEQQLETLKKLAVHLGEKILRPKTKAEAKAEIIRLQTAYDAMIAKGRAS